ncbi:MAG: DUF1761 domain-containing protein [Mycobacterium sp.]
MVPDINYLAVLVAVIVSMVIGLVFYHRAVFGRTWMNLVGHTDETVGGGSPLTYPVVVAVSFLTAWVLAGASFIAHKFYGGSFFISALITGWILWLSFTVARMLVHDLFDTRSLKLTALNALNEFITITAIALIVGVWPPAGV